ncbi:MAG TPA: PEP-CTERM sorting domain-containing protein [Phycisphaerae bacterium]
MMMLFRPSFYHLALILAAPLWSPALHAAIIGTTGAATVIAAPVSVQDGVMESNTQVYAFAEQQNITLTSAISVDVSVPGSVPASGSNNNFSVATIPIGTTISSYFLSCDAVGSPSPPVEFTGSITFDTNILGMIILNDSLNASAAFLGLPTTAYSTNGGLEINESNAFDSIILSADRRKLTFDFRDATAPDNIRFITASAVPEPGSISVLVLAGLALIKRRRRTRALGSVSI